MMLIVLLFLTFCVDIITSSVSSAFITIATKATPYSRSAVASSISSLPDLNYGLSDEDFKSWLVEEVQGCPGRNTYSSVYDEDSINAIIQWRRRFRGNPSLCKSYWYIMKHECETNFG